MNCSSMDGRKSDGAMKKFLFLTTSDYGQANVILAVAYELLLRGKYDIHIASFGQLKGRIPQINELAFSDSGGQASAATFHVIAGPSSQEVTQESIRNADEFLGPFPPGFRGAIDCYKFTLPALATAFEGPVYMTGYASCVDIIDSVDPDIIVIDPLLSQALDACDIGSRNYVVLSPNTFREVMAKHQPIFPTFFRYPAISSAFPYPVPWHLVLANVYLKIALLWIVLTNPKLKELIKFRLSKNLPKLPRPFNIWQPKNHYLVPSVPETDFPSYIASNVTGCGPILLPQAPITESDPKLLAWLERGPTVLINLGSHVRIDDAMAREFAGGLKVLLDSRPNVQILWKLKKSGELPIRPKGKSDSYGEDVTADSLKAIEQEIATGRVRVEEWMSVDPIAVLKSGHIACSVHHGGSNSFHEALSIGVPQIILPCWFDTFDFANRVEYLGVGVYGSRKSSPYVEAEEFSRALMKVMGDGAESALMRARAKEFAEITGKVGGRVKACDKIIEILESS